MQLEVKERELLPVDWNYNELKSELTEQLEKYQNLVVVEEDLPKYKSDKANLNNLKKALNSERIRIKKEYTAPIAAFENQVKELTAMIDEPISCLDDQLKKFEEKRKEEKKFKIQDAFNEINDIDQLKFNMVFDESWLNVSVSMKKIKESITAHVEKIHQDQVAITELGSDFEEDLQELYLKRFSLSEVLNEKSRRDKIIAQAEAKRKAKEEAERLAKEKAEQDEKDRIEREKKEAHEAKERELQRKEQELNIKAEAIQNNDPMPIVEKTIEQKLKENNNPEVYAQNNLEPRSYDFRVWLNEDQKKALVSFLQENSIKYGKVN